MSAKHFLLVMLSFITVQLYAQNKSLLNLKYEENYTSTWYEVVDMYKKLDVHYSNAVLIEKGLTDSGKPLHLFIINNQAEFDPVKIKSQGKSVLLINNGIHAGEPAGIEASLQFAEDIL